MIKDQQGALQENAARQKCSKYTRPQRIKVNKHNGHSDWIIFTQLMFVDDYVNSIQDGTTVILKSASYPNKAIVAYATTFSSSPKANVGGVEVGNQFYKVRINHPTEQDMSNYYGP